MPFVIDVEGLIGAGKSTLIIRLKTALEAQGKRVTLIKEPVDKWGEILPRFYADPKRWGYHFQTKAFHDRVKESIEVYREHAATTDIFITERGVLSDTFFMKTLHDQGQVDDMEYSHYWEWANMWGELMPFVPDLFVYLTPSMDETMRRVRKRNRNGEASVSVDYQELLKRKHDEAFSGTHAELGDHRVPVMHVSTDDNFKDHDEPLDSIVAQLSGYF